MPRTDVSLDQATERQPRAGIATLEGVWQGTLDAGAAKLRLVLKVVKNNDAKLIGTLDSPDQNASGITVSSIDQTSDSIKLELTSIGASYRGKMSPENMEIAGEWRQGGGSLPLVFKRFVLSSNVGNSAPASVDRSSAKACNLRPSLPRPSTASDLIRNYRAAVNVDAIQSYRAVLTIGPDIEVSYWKRDIGMREELMSTDQKGPFLDSLYLVQGSQARLNRPSLFFSRNQRSSCRASQRLGSRVVTSSPLGMRPAALLAIGWL